MRSGTSGAATIAYRRRCLEHLGIAREAVPMVLEGGAVLSDGNGTILTTEECLLNPDRNPSMDRGQIESSLLRHLGARSVVWLPFGLIGDRTSGHVDGVAAMVGPGRVIVQTDPANAQEQERLAENLSVLRASTDADGRPLDVVEFPVLPRGSFGGLPEGSFTYLNVVFARDVLIVPVTGDEALDREGPRHAGRDRRRPRDRARRGAHDELGGGGVHCITQQLPSAE